MAKKRERIRQCRQVRDLIEENKYTKALELIEEMPLEEVGSLDDLYLFADLYEKAERLDKKKQIYYMIYERTKSRYVLDRLLRLVIRLGDMEEAKNLYVTYEMSGDVNLDTYELRYLLAKASGEPRTRLIEILEDLKKEEYTEEWGFQLARLYEMEGMREECIRECKDLKLWFGKGKIIDKAMELQRRCEAPDWEPPAQEEIPDVEEPETEPMFAYASPAVVVEDMEAGEAAATEMEPEPRIQEEMVLNETRPEPQAQEEVVLNEARPESVGAANIEAEMQVVSRKKVDMASEMEVVAQAKPQPMKVESSTFYEGVSEPVVVPKKRAEQQAEQSKLTPEQEKEMLEEEAEDVSKRGIRYRTLKGTIRRIRYGKEKSHFIFAGGEENITLTVAKRITKELNHIGRVKTHNIGKITAETLNRIDLSSQVERIRGGCMLVTGAPDLTQKAVQSLIGVLDSNGDDIVVMLAGPFDEMDCFLEIYPNLAEYFAYKIRM